MGALLSLPGTKLSTAGRHGTIGSSSIEAEKMAHDMDEMPELETVPACGICFEITEMMDLHCGHSFCRPCVQGQLAARWSGSRMSFSYLNCGLCRTAMVHPELETQLVVHQELKRNAAKEAIQKFRDDGLVKDLVQRFGRDATDDEIAEIAVAEMAVLECSSCQKPYCAGRMDCAAMFERDEEVTPAVCADCEWSRMAVANDHRCMVHGHRFAMFKCDSCCAMATWNCFSNHYCERCHNQAGEEKHYPCPGPELCPLGMLHPPNRQAVHCRENYASFCIGCTACLGDTEAQEGLAFNDNNTFGFPDRDWAGLSTGRQALELMGDAEVRARLKILEPNHEAEHQELSAELCAERLLPLALQAQKLVDDAAAEQQKQRYEAERARQAEYDEDMRREEEVQREAEAQRKTDIAFWLAHDKEYWCSVPNPDWRDLREERLSKATSRCLARQALLEANSKRLQKRHWRKKHGQKQRLSHGHGKARDAHPLLGMDFKLKLEA
jgi:hypothetical protein